MHLFFYFTLVLGVVVVEVMVVMVAGTVVEDDKAIVLALPKMSTAVDALLGATFADWAMTMCLAN
jgi:hypothetical protein